MTDAASHLLDAFRAALSAVDPARCLPVHLPPQSGGRTLLFAAGKAAAPMARVALDHLDVERGLVVVPDGHGLFDWPAWIEQREARHPIPDDRGLACSARALELAGGLVSGDRLIALISGGGSALLPCPISPLTLAAKRTLTGALLRSGASIREINTVRQCLSHIKGGRLAAAAAPGEVLTFAISDIPGDMPELIASGPTVQSRATPAAARNILREYGIELSPPVRAALDDPESAPPMLDPPPPIAIIARPKDALEGATELLRTRGYAVTLAGDAIEGSAVEVARSDAALARELRASGARRAIVGGGETTVTLAPDAPPGGRNQEYALALACALDGLPGVHAAAFDTDGIDGLTDAAGAIVAPDLLGRLAQLGIDANEAVARHDAHRALAAANALVRTGPTKTNVNDLRMILIDP